MRRTTRIAGSILVTLLTVWVATAVAILPFNGWKSLTVKSPDIVIIRCSKTPSPNAIHKDSSFIEVKDGVINSEVEVDYVLKGLTNVGPSLLRSRYWPRQGEQYLLFAHFHDGFYQAFEPYRVVPLGLNVATNIFGGKPLDEQIRALLQYRLDILNGEMQQAQEEKKRLEEGLKQ